jgi:hypothetical protein
MNHKKHTDIILRCNINNESYVIHRKIYTGNKFSKIRLCVFFKATKHVGTAIRVRLPEGRTAS